MFYNVNGIDIFCVTRGSGPPLVMLHGNGESHRLFNEAAKKLARNFTVITPDSRCHGRSERTAAISYDSMAEDIAALIKKLVRGPVAFYGFSDGGIVGLKLALAYPSLLSKLVVSGVNVSPGGFKPSYAARLAALNRRRRDPLLILMQNEPRIPFKELCRVSVPVHLTVGEYDLISLRHTMAIKRRLPMATLEIVAGECHDSYVKDNDKLLRVIEKYLFNGDSK